MNDRQRVKQLVKPYDQTRILNHLPVGRARLASKALNPKALRDNWVQMEAEFANERMMDAARMYARKQRKRVLAAQKVARERLRQELARASSGWLKRKF